MSVRTLPQTWDSHASPLVACFCMFVGAPPAGSALAAAAGGGGRDPDVWLRTRSTVLPSSVKMVHVIQPSHLDVGFVDLSVNMVNLHFNKLFPEAIAWARDLEAKRSGPVTCIFNCSIDLDHAPCGLHGVKNVDLVVRTSWYSITEMDYLGSANF